MTLFYLVISLLFFLSSLTFIFKPSLVKQIITFILEKDLFIIPGGIEIIIGLGTLYFRNHTELSWFAYIFGILIFVDGIVYLAASKKMVDIYKWFSETEEKDFRTYGIFMLFIAFAYFFCGVY